MEDGLEKLMNAHFSEVKTDIKEIKIQTFKTNGRVTKLELWQARLFGGWLVLTMIIIPTAIAVITILLSKK